MAKFADLNEIAPGIDKLSTEELDAILEFTLLWTIFENEILDTNASVPKITEKVNGAKESNPNILEGDWFRDELDYFSARYTEIFSERYIEKKRTNAKFNHLNFRSNDDQELVKRLLVGSDKCSAHQLIACLIIVYRFRNNFFHGMKWAYNMEGQFDNFTHSSNLLKNCLKKFPRPE